MNDTPTIRITAHLPDGRLLIAYLDPTIPPHHSPLKRALTTANIPTHQPRPDPTGGYQPGQTPDHPPP